MKHLMINGKREDIPPFPHQKTLSTGRTSFSGEDVPEASDHGGFYNDKGAFRGYKNGCLIPRVLLLDPTSSCNLKCKGCWAADYARGDNLSFDKLDEIVTQSEKLGIMDIYMSGGEPLMRKDDILKLCRSHRKTTFGVFTNATLIDDKFADDISEAGNLIMYASIEGTREETDFRRGEGTYDKVIAAMQRMKDRGLAFAFSACYHSGNYKTIASDEFLDDMMRRAPGSAGCSITCRSAGAQTSPLSAIRSRGHTSGRRYRTTACAATAPS
jgi:sulfatase maturation enzyme AslB (radical SAM superfamily)